MSAGAPNGESMVPARMVNEVVYCPRLAYLEWVQGEWADNADTDEGRLRHRVVDAGSGRLLEPEALPEEIREGAQVRSVFLSAPQARISTRLDLVEIEGGQVIPIDYKRGRVPDLPEGAWPPERIQLCAQGIALRENGYACDHGFLYFVESRRRVRVEFDAELVGDTLAAVAELTALAEGPIPPPLDDSPKCPRCSLAGICLPDEVRAADAREELPRRLIPARDDALPLYVQAYGARVGVSGDELVVRTKDERQTVRLLDTSQVCLLGNPQLTTPAVRKLCERDIPICWFSYGGWFYGLTRGMALRNVHLRMEQHRAAADPQRALGIARRVVRSKIRNTRTLLRRNHADPPAQTLRALARAAGKASKAPSLEALLGIEGTAARHYFGELAGMLKAPDCAEAFRFEGRNRRPPTDPVNALLSFAYAMLVKDWTITLHAVGFDPFVGFLHQPRHGRPSLALDLMEEFRPLIADSAVIWAVNNGAVRPEHFIRSGKAVALTKPGRTALIRAYERRMDQLVTHPVFGYRISYRRVLEVQTRLLGRFLEGEIEDYPPFETR